MPSTATATKTTAVYVVNTESLRARAPPDKCVVYWDYENMPIPRDRSLTQITSAVRERVHDEIGAKLPVEFKVYILAEKLTPRITNDFDINGVIQIQIPSKKPEAVDKRLICDIMFDLYELERDHKSRAIALISGDKDFGHTLSKIKDVPPISHSFLILLRHVDMANMHTSVHKVLQFEFGAAVGDASNQSPNQSPPMPTRSHNYASAPAHGRAHDGSRGFQQQQQQQFVRANHCNKNFPHDQQLQSQLLVVLDMYSQSVMDASHDQEVVDDPIWDDPSDMETLNLHAPEFEDCYTAAVSSPEPVPIASYSSKSLLKKQKLTLKMVSRLDDNECVVIKSKPSNQIQNVRHQLHEKIKHQFDNAPKACLILYHKNDKFVHTGNETLQQAGIGDGDTLFWQYANLVLGGR